MWCKKDKVLIDVVGDPRLRILPAVRVFEPVIAVTGETGDLIATVTLDGREEPRVEKFTPRERKKINLACHPPRGVTFWTQYYHTDKEYWMWRHPDACILRTVDMPGEHPIYATRYPEIRDGRPGYVILADDVLGPIGYWDSGSERFTRLCNEAAFAHYLALIGLLNPLRDNIGGNVCGKTKTD